MPEQNEVKQKVIMHEEQLFINALCVLAANKNNGAEDIQNFLSGSLLNTFLNTNNLSALIYNEPGFIDLKPAGNIQDENPLAVARKKLRLVEFAAESGSLSTLQFIIEELHVDLSAVAGQPNLAERALSNSVEVRDYLLDPQAKRWLKFNDGTTDLLAHIIAERFQDALDILNENPDKICQMNNRNQNIFYWCKIITVFIQRSSNTAPEKNNRYQIALDYETKLKRRADYYQTSNTISKNFYNLSCHHASLGHFHYLQEMTNYQLALEQFKLSFLYFKMAFSNGNLIEKPAHEILRAALTAQLFCGRISMHITKTMNAAGKRTGLLVSAGFYQEALEMVNTLQSEFQIFIKDIRDNLLREYAETLYQLDNSYMESADRFTHPEDFMLALHDIEKSICYGEKAKSSLEKISTLSKNDLATMTKCQDKLMMSYRNAVTIVDTLKNIALQNSLEPNTNERETDSCLASHFEKESSRYQTLIESLMNSDVIIITSPKIIGAYVSVTSTNLSIFSLNGKNTHATNLHGNGTAIEAMEIAPHEANGRVFTAI
jgi:hypothetical protein